MERDLALNSPRRAQYTIKRQRYPAGFTIAIPGLLNKLCTECAFAWSHALNTRKLVVMHVTAGTLRHVGLPEN
jgi:hypothetical protein